MSIHYKKYSYYIEADQEMFKLADMNSNYNLSFILSIGNFSGCNFYLFEILIDLWVSKLMF